MSRDVGIIVTTAMP